MKVIGLGYPRTGTMSLKHALEMLGFGPCYHMIEVFRNPDHAAFWNDCLDHPAEAICWDTVFSGYHSTSDCPACCFWPTLVSDFPEALFVLTIRDEQQWYQSFLTTVYQAMIHDDRGDADHQKVQRMARRLILDSMFQGRFDDRDFAIQCYRQHNDYVRQTVPSDKLVVMDISEGWRPLCDALQCPVPDQPFPCSNTRQEFQNRFEVAADITATDTEA